MASRNKCVSICRVAVAMWKQYFDAHYFPERHTQREWLLNSLAYWLVALFFDVSPLPPTEAGARQSLRYVGDSGQRRMVDSVPP
jgi:hypothetical protein